jgi:hypothetical protein
VSNVYLIVFVWLADYVLACAFRPFAACRRCDGTGKLRSPSGRRGRPVGAGVHTGQ